jgi:hypothetical protein
MKKSKDLTESIKTILEEPYTDNIPFSFDDPNSNNKEENIDLSTYVPENSTDD